MSADRPLRPFPPLVPAALAVLTALGACTTRADEGAVRVAAAIAPPLAIAGSAFEAAALTTLPATPPDELPGLHNVYRLSATIVSGSEPAGDAAFAQLAAMGVKTILSVDGKVPDSDAAAAHGLRTVHVPIGYDGFKPGELLDIVKTFRELPGPFYLHCFHGKHRGPAAAAVGRVVLDGAPRELALAEMRQWCGTSPDYEGLYQAIATLPFPDEASTAAHAFDFAPARSSGGLREVMVAAPRVHDVLIEMGRRGWTVDPLHPDLDPVNEAEILAQLMLGLEGHPETLAQTEDFRARMTEARELSASFVVTLRAARAGLAPEQPLAGDAAERAQDAFERLGASCKSCHRAYRDN